MKESQELEHKRERETEEERRKRRGSTRVCERGRERKVLGGRRGESV